SYGGAVLPAIQLAELAERFGWLVVVSGNCFSSCGNYVFLSNTDKIVLRGAFVGWHGLPWSPKAVEENFDREFAAHGGKITFGPPGTTREDERAYVMESAIASEKFFSSRGLSPDLASRPPNASESFSPASADQYKNALAAGPVTWTYSRRALSEEWNVQR